MTTSGVSTLFHGVYLPLLLSACFSVFLIAGCRTTTEQTAEGESTAKVSPASSTPPFATKEPGRYQAERVITVTEKLASGSSSADAVRTIREFVARDGEKRRLEYQTPSGAKVIYLETPAGPFLLLPSSRLYADLHMAGEQGGMDAQLESDLSSDRIITQARPSTRYQNLGVVDLNGRRTTKYRVLAAANSESAPTSEALVWVDESLGMPVRSEIESEKAGTVTRVVSELQNIALEPDASLFELPKNYKKVDRKLILSITSGHRPPELTN